MFPHIIISYFRALVQNADAAVALTLHNWKNVSVQALWNEVSSDGENYSEMGISFQMDEVEQEKDR